MATPPTFIQEAETTWTSGGGSAAKTTGSFTVQANDVLAAFAFTADQPAGNTVTVAGGSLTWTQQQLHNVSSNVWGAVWTTVVDTGKSMTVTFTVGAGSAPTSVFFGANVLTFRGSDGVGASNKTQNSGGPSLALTTLTDNAAVVTAAGDWNAVDGTTRTWRTVNSITPTAGNGQEVTYFRDAAQYVTYGAYYSDAGTAGSKTVGVSAPVGQKYSILAVEIKGAAGGGGATVVKNLSALGVG